MHIHRVLVLTALISTLAIDAAFADAPVMGRAETSLRMGRERSILMTEFWVPLAHDIKQDALLYGSLRMMGDDQDNREGNLGIGYRRVIRANGLAGVAGVHGWLDRRLTERGSRFHQITSGLEWLGESVDVRMNGYIPLSDKREITIPNATPEGPELAGTGILVDTNGTILEEPQGGLDLELGLEMGQYFDVVRDNTDRLHVYAGGYYFDGPNTENVAGWRTRFTADVTEDVQFGARFQRDDERGSQGFLDATLRFPLGHKSSYREQGIRARLDESPERDIDIVTSEKVTDDGNRVQVLNAATGAPQEVLHVDNTAAAAGDGSAESPFNTLSDAQAAASAHTIIYLHRGDGTDTGQDQGIALNQTGQQLIGSGAVFAYDSGAFITANGAKPTGTLIATATSAPVVGNVNPNQDGITITADNVTVAGVTVDNANTGRDGIKVIADGASASAQNVTIQDVTTQNNRNGIYILGTNDGAVSTMLQGVVATSNNQHGVAIYDDTEEVFTADLGGGSMGSEGKNVLAGNALEDLAVEYDGRELYAQNNWWGQANGPDTDDPSSGIASQIYYGAPINDGLVGHWTLDAEWTTNTTAYDRSGNENDGAMQNGLSLNEQTVGTRRQAINLDDPAHEIITVANPDLNISGDLTMVAWVKPSNLDSGRRGVIFRNRHGYMMTIISSPTDSRLGYEGNNGTGCGFIGWCNNFSAATRNITLDEWQMVSLRFVADDQAQLYRNDQVVGQNLNIDAGHGGWVDGGTIRIAPDDEHGSPGAYVGEIDDVRIYNRALDPEELSELYRMDTNSSVNTSGYLSFAP